MKLQQTGISSRPSFNGIYKLTNLSEERKQILRQKLAAQADNLPKDTPAYDMFIYGGMHKGKYIPDTTFIFTGKDVKIATKIREDLPPRINDKEAPDFWSTLTDKCESLNIKETSVDSIKL